MPLFPRSLAAFIQRVRLFELLQMEGVPVVLHATTRCPLCSEPTLELHWDDAHHAEWVYCLACRFAGDLIELMMRKRGTGLHAVCAELMKDGALPQTPEWEIDQYEVTHLRVRREISALWTRASERMRTRDFRDLDRPLNLMGVHSQGCGQWPRQLADWMGVSSRPELEDVWHPGSYAPMTGGQHGNHRSRQRGCGPGRTRLFQGRGWEEVLLIPCFDLPGRVCGFVFVGREGDQDQGDLFYRSVPGNRRRGHQVECGILMRDQMRTVVRTPKGRVKWPGATFACTDPVEAVSLQASTVRDGFSPSLPLVGIVETDDAGATRCWSGCLTNSLVFYDPKSIERAIRAAIRVNGQVGVYPAEPSGIVRAESILEHVYQTRSPALEALASHLATLAPDTAADLVRTLELRPEQAGELEKRLKPELRARLQAPSQDRTVLVAGRTIRTNSNGWQDVRSQKWIANGTVQIDELASHGNRQIAIGQVHLDGAEYPFQADVAAIHSRGLFTVLREQLQRTGAPELFFDPRVERITWEVAVRLSRPRRTTVRDRVGWDESSQEIMLPTGAIGASGFRKLSLVAESPEALPLGNWCLDTDGEGVEVALNSLSSRERAVFASLALYVVECLLSPVLGEQPRGVLVSGDVAQEYVLGLGPAMGLLTPTYPSRLSADDQVRWLTDQTSRHGVPPILDLRDGRGQAGVARWLDGLGDRQALILAPEISLLSAQTQGRFDVLRLPESWRLPRSWRLFGPLPVSLIVRWLSDLSLRRFAFSNKRHELHQKLGQDFSDWFSTTYPGASELGGLGKLWVTSQAVGPLEALSELYSHPEIQVVVCGVDAHEEGDFVDRKRVDHALKRLKAPRIDWNSIDKYRLCEGIFPQLAAQRQELEVR